MMIKFIHSLSFWTGFIFWLVITIIITLLLTVYLGSLLGIMWRYLRCPHGIFKEGKKGFKNYMKFALVMMYEALRTESYIAYGPSNNRYFIYGQKYYEAQHRKKIEIQKKHWILL